MYSFNFLIKLVAIEFTCFLLNNAIENYRLPTNIKPIHYQLLIETNLDDELFSGSVNITINVLASTSSITLHKDLLNVSADQINILSEERNILKNVNVVNVSETNNDTHFFEIILNQNLSANNSYILSIDNFTGILENSGRGLFLTKYVDNNNNEQKLAVTQFEATYARKVFPCFDEPAFKATFQLSIVRSNDYESISNEDKLKTERINDHYEKDVFKTTKIMSTYLLAFVISKSDFIQLSKGINYRIFASHESITNNEGNYALILASNIIEILTSFLNVAYPLKKIDLFGVPGEIFDHEINAMENWGLVTFARGTLLVDNETTSEKFQEIALLVAHELAHQWFGNLVTPEWWQYLWLNEGFATYFEVFSLSKIYKGWRLFDQFTLKGQQFALLVDSHSKTTSVNPNVNTPSEIENLFNDIVYAKSGCIIRMTETFLTSNIFFTGLQQYLSKYQYSNTVPNDFYSVLQTVYDNSEIKELLPKNAAIKDVLYTWNNNPGYPLVTVIRNGSCVIFRQTRYLLSNQSNDKVLNSTWQIPITYTINGGDFNNTATKLWLTDKEAIVDLNLNDTDWIIVNIQQLGFYRVNYDYRNWKFLITLLNSENYTMIHEINRAQILDDVFSLARSENLDYSLAFDMANYIKRETDYFSLYSFTVTLNYLDMIMSQSDNYEIFKKYILQLFEKVFVRLGTNNEGKHIDKLNRNNILNWVCKYGNKKCIKEALNQLSLWNKNATHTIPPNLQKNFFCTAVSFGSMKEWEFLWNKYNIIRSSTVKMRILNGLGCSKTESILQRYMDEIIFNMSNTLLMGERSEVLNTVLNTGNTGFNFGLKYIYNNYEKIDELFLLEDYLLQLIPKIANTQNLDLLMKIPANFSDKIVDIKSNIRRINQYKDTISKWLYKNGFS